MIKNDLNAEDFMEENLNEERTEENTKTQKVLELNGRKFILVGTAHVSEKSVEEVTASIETEKPDCVAVELDEKRRESMEDSESWRKMDIIKVLKEKMGFLMFANIILSSYQKRMGLKTNVKPGDEMLAAMKKAKEMNIPLEMVDRPIAVTLRRAWAKNSLWGKCKLLSVLISSAFSKEEVSSEQIESLKKENEMDSMMSDISGFLPTVKSVLIDERDRYLASHIWECKGNNVLAVLGAGHLPGVQKYMEEIARGEKQTDCSDISEVPPRSLGSKILGWLIPVLIVALIVSGFVFGGLEAGKKMLGSWILWNGVLAAVGAIISLAHPVTILISFIGAPITSLCPFIGIGIVAGIIQALIRKPLVSDMEQLSEDAGSLKGWYKNRILRVLLVFLLSSLGSSLGTFISGAGLLVSVTAFFDKIVDFVKSIFIH